MQHDAHPETWGVLFDLDGVLIDSAHWHFESWKRLAQELGKSIDEAFFKATFGMPNPRILHMLLPDRRLTESEIRELSERKERYYQELARAGLTWIPGARELLEDLQAAGARMALVTSTPRANIDFLDQRFGLLRYFPAIVTGDDVQRGKPDPQGYRMALERLKLRPHQAVVLEDAPAGIDAAHAAGVRVIAMATTHSAEHLQTADAVVPGPHALSATALWTFLQTGSLPAGEPTDKDTNRPGASV